MEAWIMPDFFGSGAPILASTLVLVTMGFLSLVLSLSFYLKSRAVRRLPRDLPVRVLDKSFNVINPYPEQREMIHSSLIISFPVIILFAAFAFSFALLVMVIRMGLLAGLVTFVLCAALMVVDTSSEIHRNASILARAVQKGTKLGHGDLSVLSTVEKTIPKLIGYYLALAVIFLALSIVLPYVLPFAMLIFAGLLGGILELSASGGILGPVFALLLFVLAVVMIRVTVSKIKTGVFGLPQSETSVNLDKPFEAVRARAGFYYVWEHDELLRRPPPEESEAKDLEESGEQESERK